MKIKELINKLQELDKEKEVLVYDIEGIYSSCKELWIDEDGDCILDAENCYPVL